MNPRYEKLCDRINAVNAEFRLRRQIELTTGKTPEMLTKYATRRPLAEHSRILLEAWQDADEATIKAIAAHEKEKGDANHVQQA